MDLKYAIESRKLDQQNLAKVKFSNGEVIIPTGETAMMPGDRMVLFARTSALTKLQKLFKG